MSGRDPRVTPRAGDVLRIHGYDDVEVAGWHYPSGCLAVNSLFASHVRIGTWRRWAAGAEVLRRAEEVQ